jgi:sugar phosphate isomerase/epimerase
MSIVKIGLQMYSLRKPAEQDFVGTLRRVAEMGYQGVEFAGYGGLTAAQLRDVLDELGLVAVGSHVSVERLQHHLDEEVEFQRTLGSQYVVCPFLPPQFRPDPKQSGQWQQTLDLFNQAGRAFAEVGIRFGYHNHSFEFEEKVGDQFLFDALFAGTEANLVSVELDTCWAEHAGQSAVAYLERYAGRVPLIHLKDLSVNDAGTAETVALGEGSIDLESIVAAAEAAGVRWLIVEQDECQYDPFESVANSMKWLRQRGIAG